MVGTDRLDELLLDFAPDGQDPGKNFFSFLRQIKETLTLSGASRNRQETLFLHQAETAGERCTVGDENIREVSNGGGLGFGQGNEYAELG